MRFPQLNGNRAERSLTRPSLSVTSFSFQRRSKLCTNLIEALVISSDIFTIFTSIVYWKMSKRGRLLAILKRVNAFYPRATRNCYCQQFCCCENKAWYIDQIGVWPAYGRPLSLWLSLWSSLWSSSWSSSWSAGWRRRLRSPSDRISMLTFQPGTWPTAAEYNRMNSMFKKKAR